MTITVEPPDVQHIKSQLGGFVRRGNHEGAEQARRALEMAKREQAIRVALEAAPPLDADTLARIRALIPAPELEVGPK